jgi:two-component system response regulator AtoC
MARSNRNVNDNVSQKLKQLKLTCDSQEKIAILKELTQTLFHTNKAQAKKYALRALRFAKEKSDQNTVAQVSNLLADILRLEGKIDQALKYAKIGLEFGRRAKDKKAEADSLNNLGLIFWHRGEFDKAIEGFNQSLKICEITKDELAQSRAYTNLSLLYWEKGNLNLAMEYQKQALEIKERIRDSHGIGISQLNLGLIYGDMGDWDKAIEYYYRALVEMEKLGNKTDIGLCYNNLGEIYLKRNKLDKARELLEAAIKNADLAASPWVKAEALGNLGEVYFRAGDWVCAHDCYNQDLKLSAEMDDKEEIAETYRRIGELLLDSGEKEEASKVLHKGLDIVKLTGAKKENGNILRVLGKLYFELNKPIEAKSSFQKGLEILKELGNNYELGKIYTDYGKTIANLGDRDIGLSYLHQAKGIFEKLGANYELATVESFLSKLGVERERAQTLLRNLTAISILSNSFVEFGQSVLKELKETLNFGSGTFSIYRGETATIGDFNSEELTAIGRRRELQTEPLFICCPICLRGKSLGILYLKWREPGKTVADNIFLETIMNILALGIERIAAKKEIKPVEGLTKTEFLPYKIVGAETSLRPIFDIIQKVAPTKVCVLIQGESGTGKELVARTIHQMSDRAEKPFIPINCAAIPETLLESELFGIEKGTATGVSERKGKFEIANSGTVFLDEIGDMSLALQAKILRLVQEKQFDRVGGRKIINVDIRIIAATNKDLPKAIENGTFREDLYYRLNVVPIFLPALRKRKEDFPQLVTHFIDKYCREYQRNILGLSEEAMARFFNYSWPGNVRELENVIERAIVLARGDRITLADLPPIFQQIGDKVVDFHEAKIQAKVGVASFEKEFIIKTLNQFNWNITKAAKAMEITRRHLYRLMKKFQIEQR